MDNVVVLNRFVPTTKTCINCGNIIDINLNQRTFKCECGVEEDRDIHAAKNMIWFEKNNIGVGRTDFKPVELKNLISKALKQEDAMSLA
jgi:transposase